MLSFFRKLSIGWKVRDGMLPETIMGTTDVVNVKDQNAFALKTDLELKESVYGKF